MAGKVGEVEASFRGKRWGVRMLGFAVDRKFWDAFSGAAPLSPSPCPPPPLLLLRVSASHVLNDLLECASRLERWRRNVRLA